MQASPGLGSVERVRDIVDQRRDADPGVGLGAVVEYDVLPQLEPQVLLHELPVRRHLLAQHVYVVQPPHPHAPARMPLGLVLQRGALVLGSAVLLSLVVDLHQVAVRIIKAVGWTMARIILDPPFSAPALLERPHPAVESLRAGRAPTG